MTASSWADYDDTAEPSVDFLNSNLPVEVPKSNIGVRKIQPKKGGIGAKKGLGATRVKTNFADVEQRANLADQLKEPVIERKPMTEEEEAEAMTSVRLAYQDMSLKKQKEEDRLKTVDPNKAKQIERLGMGFGNRGGVSHSALSDMQTINQDQAPISMKPAKSESSSKNDFFDDYSTSMYSSSSSNSLGGKQDFSDAMMMGFEPIESKQNVHSMFSPVEKKDPPSAVADRQPSSSSFGRNNREKASKASEKSPDYTGNSYDTDSIQKKFAGAKGISSDQFFGNEQSAFERSANLSKFQGSSSISSADYFNDGSQSNASRREFMQICFLAMI